MKTLTITAADCILDEGRRYHHAPIICKGPTHVHFSGMREIVLEASVGAAVIYTFGGDLNTGGGNLTTGGGSLYTDGGSLYTDGGNLTTGGGSLYTDGGSLYTDGGNLDTRGGNLDTGGGNLDTGGGNLYTSGGYLDTACGDLYTRGGNLYTGGGNISTFGGDLTTGGGDLDTNGANLLTWGGDIDTLGGRLNTGGGRINGYPVPALKVQLERLHAVREQIESRPNKLDMGQWHGRDDWRQLKPCETTHCVAGWLQVLSDDEKLRSLHATVAAAILAPITVPHFYESNEQVRAWLESL